MTIFRPFDQLQLFWGNTNKDESVYPPRQSFHSRSCRRSDENQSNNNFQHRLSGRRQIGELSETEGGCRKRIIKQVLPDEIK